MAKISKEARAFISKKIKANINEGKPFPQAVAIAYSQAREAGYKVPVRKSKYVKSKHDIEKQEKRFGFF